MADCESVQTYSPPEWIEQHVINQPLVLKDIGLALSLYKQITGQKEEEENKKQ